MKKILAAGALALLSVAGSAQAAPTITFNGGSGMLPTGSTVVQTFDSFAANSMVGTNAFALASSGVFGAKPAFGSTGNFLAVFNGGNYTTMLPAATSLFSFVLGSLDAFNVLTLSFADNSSMTYTGDQIVNRTTLLDAGSQTDAQTNGVVSFATGTGPLITGASFASIGGSSFEVDNLATGGTIPAVPEPAAWAMMILGFALVGGALRRRSATAKVTFA